MKSILHSTPLPSIEKHIQTSLEKTGKEAAQEFEVYDALYVWCRLQVAVEPKTCINCSRYYNTTSHLMPPKAGFRFAHLAISGRLDNCRI